MNETVAFEVHKSKNGVPRIIGNAKERMENKDKFFLVVFRPSGERETMHPLPVRDLCLYEVAVGDFISVMERVDCTLYVNACCVRQITDQYVIAVPASM